MRDAAQIGEARHDLAHGHLVEGDHHAVEFIAVAVLAVGLVEEDQVLRHVAEDLVGKLMAHAQVGAAQAEDILVHEAVAAEVGDHPAIPQRAVHGGDQVLGEGAEQHAPHLCPFIEVVGGIPDAAPLTADGRHGALAVEAAEASLAVDNAVPLLGVIQGHEVLVLALGALPVGLAVVDAILTELFPVGALEKLPGDAEKLGGILALLLPVHIVFGLPEFRIRVDQLFLFSHSFVPPCGYV